MTIETQPFDFPVKQIQIKCLGQRNSVSLLARLIIKHIIQESNIMKHNESKENIGNQTYLTLQEIMNFSKKLLLSSQSADIIKSILNLTAWFPNAKS